MWQFASLAQGGRVNRMNGQWQKRSLSGLNKLPLLEIWLDFRSTPRLPCVFPRLDRVLNGSRDIRQKIIAGQLF